MTDNQSDLERACKRNCWIAAVLLGIAVMGVAQSLIGWHWVLSLIVGLIAAGLMGWLLPTYFCVSESSVASSGVATHDSAIAAETASNEVAVDEGAVKSPDMEKVADTADSQHAPADAARTEATAAASGWSGAGAGLMRAPGTDSNVGTAKYSYTPQIKPEPKKAAAAAPAPADEAPAEEAPPAPAPQALKITEPSMPQGSGARAGGAWGGSGGSLMRGGAAASGSADTVTPSELASAVEEAGDAHAPVTTPSSLLSEVEPADGGTPSELAGDLGGDAEVRVTPSELAGAVEDTDANKVETRQEESEPDLYTSAPSEVDNLKEIKGVGPGLERTLNEMGIYKFAQIAQWGEAEIAWVDARLKFKGRIVRDGWVAQATVLASGGDTDFSRRVDEGDVYGGA